MLKRFSLALAVVIVLVLASGTWMPASAEDIAVVPFKAYYPVWAVQVGPSQTFYTADGGGIASHMGLSQFDGQATVGFWDGQIHQIGDGTLWAANGDYLTIHYAGIVVPIDAGHVVTDGWYTVTGGGGRFEDMTGEGTYHVYVHLAGDQPNDLWFEGTLTKK